MKSCCITLALLISCFELCLFADIPQRKEMVKLANQYIDAIEDYSSKPIGLLEINAKNALRDKYLSCSASDTELIYELGAYVEVVYKINQWKLKCSRGLLHKLEPTVSPSEFIHQAQQYAILHKQVSQSPEYQKLKKAHKEYKKMVLNLLGQGFTVTHINDTLKSYGVSHDRVLDKTEYWRKKIL